jgi:signal transduction histidine kinase
MMATTQIAIDRAPNRSGALPVVGATVIGLAAAALAAVGAGDREVAVVTAAAVAVAAWAVLTVFLAARRPQERLWVWTGAGALVGAGALATNRMIGVVPFVGLGIALALPTGALVTRFARVVLMIGVVIAVPAAAVIAATESPSTAFVVGEIGVLAALAVIGFVHRCRGASAIDRARLQWAGWGVVVAGALGLVIWLTHELIGWPDALGVPIVLGTLFVPLALALAATERVVLRIDRLLVRTIETGGLVLLVGVIYLVVVLGFGDSPTDADHRVLGLSLVAAALAALCFVPARNRLEEFANRRVYGELRAPDEPLQSFGARMSRAIPLDELLLQLAESLKKSMQLAASEVWTGTEGLLERAAAVPYREIERIRLGPEEEAVVARAHVQGNAWVQVWLSGLLDEHPGQTLRVAPLVHSGELLGLIVCARAVDQQPFSEEEERVITELARQVALALHNSALDTALQASLDELRIANDELQASRARIVATADQSRRQIERNLHDGAQQHLVALAVKLGLARQLVDSDREALGTLLEELRADAQTTLTELRELAHGIYPPLLMDRGLPEALRAAANRSVLATDVDADVGRFPAEVEAAVYFCCLEALQNAGKHAGETARIMVAVHADDHELHFSVADDGAGFDVNGSAARGHGFVNMTDRLGAIGGSLIVDSAPGTGTRISGEIPLSVRADAKPESN